MLVRTAEGPQLAVKPELMPTLKRGDTGKGMRELQSLLFDMDVATDGIFGAHTEKAVRRFQKRFGLKVDGIVGPKTWAALECASRPAPAEPVIDFDYMDQPPEDRAWRWIGLAIVAFAVVLFVGYLATAGP